MALLASTRAFVLDLRDRSWEMAHTRYLEAVVQTQAMDSGEVGYEHSQVVPRLEQARALVDALYDFSNAMGSGDQPAAVAALKARMERIDSLRYDSMM